MEFVDSDLKGFAAEEACLAAGGGKKRWLGSRDENAHGRNAFGEGPLTSAERAGTKKVSWL